VHYLDRMVVVSDVVTTKGFILSLNILAVDSFITFSVRATHNTHVDHPPVHHASASVASL
jgi:hypothetical protein